MGRVDIKSGGGTFASSLTLTGLNLGTNSGRAVLVVTGIVGSGTPQPTECRVGGPSGELLTAGTLFLNGSARYYRCFYGLVTGTGAQDVVLTYSSNLGNPLAVAVSYDGVSSIRTPATAFSVSSAPSVVVTTVSGDRVVLVGVNSDTSTTFTGSPPCTSWGLGSGLYFGGDETAAAATTTIDGTLAALSSWHVAGFALVPEADTTAPTLSSPTGTATGSSTASGTVTTNEAGGTLYRLASINATETAAAVVAAGLSQAVGTSGVQNVTFTGLSGSTTYYAHYVHDDAALNRSARVSSAAFTTATPSDTTAPTLAGSITASAITTVGYTLSWPAGSDNVAVTGYEVSLNGGTSWSDVGAVLSVPVSGRAPGSTDAVRVRAYDAAGNRSTPALAANVTLLNTSITLGPFASSGSLWPIGTAIHYEWQQGGRIGSAPTSVTRGSVTNTVPGLFTIAGLPAGAGLAIVAKRNSGAADDEVGYFPGTVA